MDSITGPGTAWITIVGIVGVLAIGLATYWVFNKRARLRDLARVREMLDRLEPSDREYNDVRALYTSMVIDAHRWGLLDSGSGSDGHGTHGVGDHHHDSDVGHSGHAGSGDGGGGHSH